MDKQRKIIIVVSVGAAAALAMTAAAMTPHAVNSTGQHMSALKVSGLAGYTVRDSDGRDVGRVLNVETDSKGRTRYVNAALNGGEKVRVAAFRAQLDTAGQTIDLTVPVAAVVNDPSALVAPSPSDAKLIVASVR